MPEEARDMNVTEESNFTPPYLPFSKITGMLQRMREQGVPGRIDRSYLTWLPGIDQTYLMATLRTFGWTDDLGHPTDDLKALVDADPAQERKIIGDLLKTYYAGVFAKGPNATQAQLEGVFKDYGVKGSTVRKAITFFLKAAEHAGLSVSPLFKTPRAVTAPAGARRGGRKKDTAAKPKGKPKPGLSTGNDAADSEM